MIFKLRHIDFKMELSCKVKWRNKLGEMKSKERENILLNLDK